MPRFTKLIAGCHVTDIASDEGGYNYYLYTRTDGSGVIMRGNTAGIEFRFFLFGKGNVSTIWSNRAHRRNLRYCGMICLLSATSSE